MLYMAKNKNVSTGIIWGVGLGVLYCILLFIRWRLAGNLLSFGVYAFVGYAVILGLLFFESNYRKKREGGFIELKELFQTLFVSVLLFELFYSIFNLLYLKWIDPGVIDRLKKGTELMMDKMAMPDDQKKLSLQSIDDLKLSTETGSVIKGYFTSVAVSGVLAFFIALIMRKRKPVVAETN